MKVRGWTRTDHVGDAKMSKIATERAKEVKRIRAERQAQVKVSRNRQQEIRQGVISRLILRVVKGKV
jgi:hypothetical protein